jgi:hypothetical protein
MKRYLITLLILLASVVSLAQDKPTDIHEVVSSTVSLNNQIITLGNRLIAHYGQATDHPYAVALRAKIAKEEENFYAKEKGRQFTFDTPDFGKRMGEEATPAEEQEFLRSVREFGALIDKWQIQHDRYYHALLASKYVSTEYGFAAKFKGIAPEKKRTVGAGGANNSFMAFNVNGPKTLSSVAINDTDLTNIDDAYIDKYMTDTVGDFHEISRKSTTVSGYPAGVVNVWFLASPPSMSTAPMATAARKRQQ